MVNVSVVVLTKNEERNIRDCLKTVAGWADEILIVDDESTDNTLSVVANYTDKIIKRKMDNEGKHRNFAYSKAKNTWVLSIDADERVTDELKKEIEHVISAHPEYNGFTVPIRNYIGSYWVKHAGWYPAAKLRLFKRDKFKYEEVNVHPRAFMDDPCGHLKSDIIHYSYRNLEDFFAKVNAQTTREADKWYTQKRPMRLGHFIWRTVDRFFRSFLGKKGYKDGFMGFVVAYNAALYQFLSYLKYREICMEKENKQ